MWREEPARPDLGPHSYTPDIRHKTSDTRHQTPKTRSRHQTPDTRHQTPDTILARAVLDTRHQTPAWPGLDLLCAEPCETAAQELPHVYRLVGGQVVPKLGPGVHLQGQECRYPGAGTQVQVPRCRYSGAGSQTCEYQASLVQSSSRTSCCPLYLSIQAGEVVPEHQQAAMWISPLTKSVFWLSEKVVKLKP